MVVIAIMVITVVALVMLDNRITVLLLFVILAVSCSPKPKRKLERSSPIACQSQKKDPVTGKCIAGADTTKTTKTGGGETVVSCLTRDMDFDPSNRTCRPKITPLQQPPAGNGGGNQPAAATQPQPASTLQGTVGAKPGDVFLTFTATASANITVVGSVPITGVINHSGFKLEAKESEFVEGRAFNPSIFLTFTSASKKGYCVPLSLSDIAKLLENHSKNLPLASLSESEGTYEKDSNGCVP